MAISVGYVARETATNIRRNLLMTIGGVLTVALAFAAAGAGLLLRTSVDHQGARFRNNTEIRVFMKADASEQQIQAVKTQLASTPEVAEVLGLCDKPCAYKEMQQSLSKDALTAITEDEAPPSFRIKLAKADLADAVNARFKDQPGVLDVVYNSKAIRDKVKADKQKQTAFFVISIVVLVGAVILILTTAQLAILSRRREVAVMKLVGATNWFIRIPFILEGVVQGLFGAGVAFLFVYIARNGIVSAVTEPFLGSQLGSSGVSAHDALIAGLWLLIGGAIIGAIGSAVAVGRFLDV